MTNQVKRQLPQQGGVLHGETDDNHFLVNERSQTYRIPAAIIQFLPEDGGMDCEKGQRNSLDRTLTLGRYGATHGDFRGRPAGDGGMVSPNVGEIGNV